MARCDDGALAEGAFCEGDGECDTDTALNNCGADLDLSGDVYRVVAVAAPCPDLEAVPVGECPTKADIRNCAKAGLAPGDLCEGDGECGTDKDLDNCPHDGAFQADIYRVVGGTPAPTPRDAATPGCPPLEVVLIGDCPADADIDACDTPGLGAGDLCEGDGECGTDTDLNNCPHDGKLGVARRR